MNRLTLAIAIFVVSTGVMAAGSNPPGVVNGVAPAASEIDVDRSALIQEISAKWSREAQARGMSAAEWDKWISSFGEQADPMNLLTAAEMPTFQLMTDTMSGQPLESESVQKALASDGTKALGSTISDTTYTPLPNGRCRVADSRVIASPLPGGVVRAIDTEDTASYASQGGNGSAAGDGSSNCGIPSFATALAVSISVLTTGNSGFFKLFENGQAFSTGNTVLYEPAVSASNDVIVKSCQSCALELSVYSNTNVHYVLDVIGYYMPSEATALQCVETANTDLTIAAGGTGNAVAPACATGYTQTATNCESSTWQMPFVYFQSGTCSAQNNSAGSATLRASRTCCRVPGR